MSLFFPCCVRVLQVIRMLGNGRLEGHCFDGQTRLCHIRGKMRKKVWVSFPAYNLCILLSRLPHPP
jgi:translation initiation factor 1A